MRIFLAKVQCGSIHTLGGREMNHRRSAFVLLTAVLLAVVVFLGAEPMGEKKSEEESKIARGLEISPVPVRLDDRNKTMIGLGSYLINAAGGCANCHTCPTYSPAGSKGKGKQINAQNYMAGGVPFAEGITSANLTPDAHGLPGGLTLRQFNAALMEGHKPLEEAVKGVAPVPPPGEAYYGQLAVMPWPIYQHLTTSDREAMYEYLKAIPPAKPGTCTGPGQ